MTSLASQRSHANSVLNCGEKTLNDDGNAAPQSQQSMEDETTVLKKSVNSSSGSFPTPTFPISPRRSIPSQRPSTPAIVTSHHAGSGNGNGRPSTPTPRQSVAAVAPSSLSFTSGAAATRSPGVATTRQRPGSISLHDRGSFRKFSSLHDASSSTNNPSSISPGLSELLQSRSRIRRQHSIDDRGRSTSAEALAELLESRSTFRRHHSHEDHAPSPPAGFVSPTSAFTAASPANLGLAGAAGKRSSFSGVTSRERTDGSNRPKLSDFKFSSLDERSTRPQSSSPTLAALGVAAKSEGGEDQVEHQDGDGADIVYGEALQDEPKAEEELEPQSRFPFVPMDFRRINTASTVATMETSGGANASVTNQGADETPTDPTSSTTVAPEKLGTNTSEKVMNREVGNKTIAFNDTSKSQENANNLDEQPPPIQPKVEEEPQAKSTRLKKDKKSLRSFHQDSTRSFTSLGSSLHNSLNAGAYPKSSGSVVTFCESLTSTSYYNGVMCPSSSGGSESNSDDSYKTKKPNNSASLSNSSETLGASNARNSVSIFRDDRSEACSTPLATVASSYTSFASTSSVASVFSGGEESLFQRQNSKSGRTSSFRERKSGSGPSDGDTKTPQHASNVLSTYHGMSDYCPKGKQKPPSLSKNKEQPKVPSALTHQKIVSKQLKNQKSNNKPMISLELPKTKDDSITNIRESISQVKKLISNVENNGTYDRSNGMKRSMSFNGRTNESFDDDDMSATSQDIASLKRTLASLQEASKILEEQKRLEEEEQRRMQKEEQEKSKRRGSFMASQSLCDHTDNQEQSPLLKAAKDLLRSSSNDVDVHRHRMSVTSASTAVTYLTQQPKDHDAANNRAGSDGKLSIGATAPVVLTDTSLNSGFPKLLAFFDMSPKTYHEKFHVAKTKKSRMPMTMSEKKVEPLNVVCTEPPPPPPPSCHPSPSKSHKDHNHTPSSARDNGNRGNNSINEANTTRLDSSDIPRIPKPPYSQLGDIDKKRKKDSDRSSRSLSRQGDRRDDQSAPPSRQCTNTIVASSSKTPGFYESHRHHPYPKSSHKHSSQSFHRGHHSSSHNLRNSLRSSAVAKFPPPPPPPSRKNKIDPDGYHSVTASLIHLPHPEKKPQRRESRHADMPRKTRGSSSGRSPTGRSVRKNTSLTSSLKKLSTIQKEKLADHTAPGEVTLIGYNDEYNCKTVEEESQTSLIVATDIHSRSKKRDDNPYVVANPYVVPLRKGRGSSFRVDRPRESSRDASRQRNEFEDMRHRNRSMSPMPQPTKVEAEMKSSHGRKLSRGRPSSRQPRAPSKSRSSSRNRQENNNISPTTVVLTNLISNAIEEAKKEDKHRNRKKERSHRKSRNRHRSSSPRTRNRASSLPHGTTEFHDAQIAHVARDRSPSKGHRSSKSPSRISVSSNNHQNHVLKRSMSSGRITYSDFDAVDAALRANSHGRSKSKNRTDSNGRSGSNGRIDSNNRRGKKSNLHRGMSKSFHEDYLPRGVDISTLKSRM